MASIKHKKVNTVPAWNQADLDAAIAGAAAPPPPGTLISGFTTTQDWNDDHDIDLSGLISAGMNTTVTGSGTAGSPFVVSTIDGTINSGTAANAFGDSFTVGVGASTPSLAYIPLLAADKDWTISNYAVSGSMAADQASAIYAQTIGDNTISTYGIGLNDERIYFTDTGKLKVFQSIHQAELAYMAIPNANKVLGLSSAVTYTGTWNNTLVYGLGKSSSQSGATAAFTLYGSNLLIAMIQQDSNIGTYTITVDGVLVDSYTTLGEGQILTFLGTPYAPKLIVVPNLTEGAHNVVITVTSSAPGVVYFDWAAGTNDSLKAGGPSVYVSNIVRRTAASYTIYGGSPANVITYNVAIKNNIAYLASLGLNITLVDIASMLNITTDLSVDETHPSDAGHSKIRDGFVTATNRLIYPRERQVALTPVINLQSNLQELGVFTQGATDGWQRRVLIDDEGIEVINGNVEADALITNGGTSSQFVKGNGTLDSSVYITSSALTGYVPYTGATTNVDLGAFGATSSYYRTPSTLVEVGNTNTIGTGTNRITVGIGNSLTANSSFAIGQTNNITGASFGIGSTNTVNGTNSFALGSGNFSYGIACAAIGANAQAGQASSLSTALIGAVGVNAKAYTASAFSVGVLATANAPASLNVSATATGSVCFRPSLARIQNTLNLINGNTSAGDNLNPLERLHSTGNVLASNIAVLGAEKVSNPTFTGTTSWTYGADWANTGGTVAQKTGTGTTTLTQTIANMVSAPVIGEYYQVSFTVAAFNAGTVGTVAELSFSYAGVNILNFTGAPNALTQGASGAISFVIKAVNTTGDLTFTPTANCRVTIDNISIKPILGGDLQAIGGLKLATGKTSSTSGTGTLVAGTATIATTAVATNSMVFATSTNNSLTNVGALTAPLSGITAGTSFTVTSTNVLDTSTFNWFIINPL